MVTCRALMLVASAVAAMAIGQAAAAQALHDLPDPATIALPDVSPVSDPQQREDGLKFFYFYKPGIGFAAAHADLVNCTRYLANGEALLLPGFVPWAEEDRRKPIVPGIPNYGIVGALIGAMVAGPLERGRHNSIMRRCMETRGYARYPLRKDSWRAILDGDGEQALLKMAKLASGKAPGDAALTE